MNTFTQNAAYFDTVGVVVRIKATGLFTSSMSTSAIMCYGVKFQENTFEKNFGCPAFGGPTISVECYDPTVSTPEDSSND